MQGCRPKSAVLDLPLVASASSVHNGRRDHENETGKIPSHDLFLPDSAHSAAEPQPNLGGASPAPTWARESVQYIAVYHALSTERRCQLSTISSNVHLRFFVAFQSG